MILVSGQSNTHSEALDESQVLHGFSQIRITVIRDPGRPEIFARDLPKRTSRTEDFNPVIELTRIIHGAP